MNKKKRALALGLATTQLAALSAVVAPLTAFAADPAETKINISETEYTVKTPAKDDCKGYTVSAAAGTDSDNGKIVVTITIADGYAADGNSTVPTSNVSGVTFTEVKTDDKVTGWSASFEPSTDVTDKTYDFTADGALAVTVLQVITPTIKLPDGTTGVALADTLEKDDSDHSKAITEAEKIEFVVESGVNDVTLTKDTDYSVKCTWADGTDDSAGKVTAALELTDAAKAKYALSSENPITVDVPVTYKQEEEAKAITFTVAEVAFSGKLDAEPTLDEIKEKLSLTFSADNETVTLGDTDYTVDVKKLDTAEGENNYSATVSLSNTVTGYTLSEDAKTVNFKVTYTVKAEVEVTLANSITAANSGNLSDQVTVTLEKVVTAEDGTETKTEVTSGSKVKEDDALVLTVTVKDGFKFADNGALKVTLGSDEQTAQADGTYKFTAGTDAMSITVSGTLEEDKTPYKITLPESADQYEVSVKYTDNGENKTEIPADGLPVGTEITITLTAKNGYKLVSAKLGESAAVNSSDSGATVELTYTVARPESGDTIALTLGEVKYQTVIKPEFSTISDAVELSVPASAAIPDEDKAKIVAAAKTALGSSVDGLTADTDYELTVGSADTDNNKVSVTFELKNTDDYVLDDSLTAPITVDVPVKFVEEYDISAESENENVTVTLTDTDGNALTKAYVGAKVKINVAAKTNHTLRSAKLGSADIPETGLEYTIVESDVKETNGSKAITLAVTAKTVPVVTVSGTVSDPVVLTKTTKFSEALDETDKTAILDAVGKAIKFDAADGSSDTTGIAENTDYTIEVDFTKGSTSVSVNIKPVDTSENFDVTEATISVTVTFAKTALAVPALKSANTESAPASIPAGSDDATIKELLLAEIDNLPEDLTICDITVADNSIGSATEANDTAAKLAVTFKVNDANKSDYEFKDGETAKETVEVEVWYKISAPAAEITAVLAVKEGFETVYVNAAPTVENIKAALGNDGIKVTFTGDDPDNAPELTADDYELTYEYADGTFTVSFVLKNKLDYKLKGDVTPATVTVWQVLAALPAVDKQSFEKGDTTAKDKVKTAVENALKTAWGDDVTATVTVGNVDVSAVTTEDATVDVTVTVSGIYVLDNTGKASGTITVKYSVTESVVDPTTYAITVAAAENGTVNVSLTTAAEGDEVTITAKAANGFEVDTIKVTKNDNTEITVTDNKFTMPAEAVTVTVTFKESTGTSTEESYKITVTKPANGTVTADKTTAKKGDTVTLTVTPANGYSISKLTVTDKDGSPVTVANSKFTMPDSDVTVTAVFNRNPSSGSSSGSSRPSGGSSSSSSSSTTSTSNSEISSMIGSTNTGDTVKVEGNIYIFSDVVKSAADKNVDLEVKINDTFTWNIDANKLADTDDALRLSVDLTTVNRTETAKIERSAGAADNVEMSFSTIANNLGTGATLTVKTSARPTAEVPQFANLYRTKADGTLEFVAAAPVDAYGNAVLPIGEAATYTIVTSSETKKPGDINNDCKVDLTDLAAALSKYVNSTSLTRSEDFKMDHNGDGTCKLSDITLMLNDFVNGKLK